MKSVVMTDEVPAPGRRLLVAEVFGPTFQGEGPSTGQVAMFLRLSRCNLSCGFCDTPYTWNWAAYDVRAESTSMTRDAVVNQLVDTGPDLVVITGGEPLLQAEAVCSVVAALVGAGKRVEIETNGTICPPEDLVRFGDAVRFNVSPKLGNSSVAYERRVVPSALRRFAAAGAVFKFVVAGESDLDEITDLASEFGLAPWVMPEGTDPEALTDTSRWLADAALERGWNFSGRLHVMLWGDVRGR